MNGVAFAGNAPLGERSEKNFIVIIPGENCEIFCGGKIPLFEGEVAVVPPLVKHSVKGARIAVELEQALLPFKKITKIADDAAGGITHAAEQAVRYFAVGGKELILQALGELIVSYLSAFCGVGLSPVSAFIKEEILKNLSTANYSLEDSLKKLPLNYDYVRKLFKKETGITPLAYLTSCRMKLARELLGSGMGNKYSNYSVAQIAEACGYSEPLYFSRVFKKYYGESPSEYAQKARKKRAP